MEGLEFFLKWCEEFFNTDFLYSMNEIITYKVNLGGTPISLLGLCTCTGLLVYLVVAIIKWIIT